MHGCPVIFSLLLNQLSTQTGYLHLYHARVRNHAHWIYLGSAYQFVSCVGLLHPCIDTSRVPFIMLSNWSACSSNKNNIPGTPQSSWYGWSSVNKMESYSLNNYPWKRQWWHPVCDDFCLVNLIPMKYHKSTLMTPYLGQCYSLTSITIAFCFH